MGGGVKDESPRIVVVITRIFFKNPPTSALLLERRPPPFGERRRYYNVRSEETRYRGSRTAYSVFDVINDDNTRTVYVLYEKKYRILYVYRNGRMCLIDRDPAPTNDVTGVVFKSSGDKYPSRRFDTKRNGYRFKSLLSVRTLIIIVIHVFRKFPQD